MAFLWALLVFSTLHYHAVRCSWVEDDLHNLARRILESRSRSQRGNSGGGNPHDPEGCSQRPADIVFVLDESGSIWGPDFDRQLTFVNNVINVFTIGEEFTHIGLMTFGTDPHVVMTLGQHVNDKGEMQNVISKVKQRRGNTRTDLALGIMRHTLFSPSSARSGVPHVGIVITDGNSEYKDKTQQQANQAKQEGITMFAIGVGREIGDQELKDIASNDDYVFRVESYEMLDKLKEIIAWEACQAPTPRPPQMLEGCEGSRPLDVLFATPDEAGILDTEASLGFVQSIVEGFRIGENLVQTGLTPRLCGDLAPIGLREHDEKEALQAAIARRGLESTLLSQQLEYLVLRGFTHQDSGRENAKRVAVLIVDNAAAAPSSVRQLAEDAKADGIVLIVIGVGGRVDQQLLTDVASSSGHAFFVDSYEELGALVDDVNHTLCTGRGPLSLTLTTAQPSRPQIMRDCEGLIPFDILFSIPDEAGVTDSGLALAFVRIMSERFWFGPNQVQAGLTPRWCWDSDSVHFQENGDKRLFFEAIARRELSVTGLSRQLRYLLEEGFRGDVGARNGVMRFAILLVDNRSKDPETALHLAEEAKQRGLLLIVVGLGSFVDRVELEQIASPNHCFFLDGYVDLHTVALYIGNLMCDDISY